jgi:hypothetical protein
VPRRERPRDGTEAATLEMKPHDFRHCPRMEKFTDDDLFRVIKEGGEAGGTTGCGTKATMSGSAPGVSTLRTRRHLRATR